MTLSTQSSDLIAHRRDHPAIDDSAIIRQGRRPDLDDDAHQ
jgi:hypothetical protein